MTLQHVEAGAIGQAEVEQDRVPSLPGPHLHPLPRLSSDARWATSMVNDVLERDS